MIKPSIGTYMAYCQPLSTIVVALHVLEPRKDSSIWVAVVEAQYELKLSVVTHLA